MSFHNKNKNNDNDSTYTLCLTPINVLIYTNTIGNPNPTNIDN